MGRKEKRELKIRIFDGNILSYNSINDVFKNNLKCNMFDSDIKLSMSEHSINMDLKCKINKWESVELLLEELPKYFTMQNIRKETEYKCIFLEAVLFSHSSYMGNKTPRTEMICEKQPSVRDKSKGWFSIYINGKEFCSEQVKKILLYNFKQDFDKIDSIEIENFSTFVFNCEDKKFSLNYKDFNIE